jgi:expansin (peptidoglycan-binding protein)
MIGTQTGEGTYYATGLGACGITNNDSDYICAVSHLMFDSFPGYQGGNPNNNPICGRRVSATYQGKTITLTITDRCEACKVTDLDLSPTAFSQLADFGVGRIQGVTWNWI